MSLLMVIYVVLLLLTVVLGPPWGLWGDRAPAWSAHTLYLILFVIIALVLWGPHVTVR